eukprot:2775791-Pyramimonas_sp.AAC.1
MIQAAASGAACTRSTPACAHSSESEPSDATPDAPSDGGPRSGKRSSPLREAADETMVEGAKAKNSFPGGGV